MSVERGEKKTWLVQNHFVRTFVPFIGVPGLSQKKKKKTVSGRIRGHWNVRQRSFSLVLSASLPIQIGRKDLFVLLILLRKWKIIFLFHKLFIFHILSYCYTRYLWCLFNFFYCKDVLLYVSYRTFCNFIAVRRNLKIYLAVTKCLLKTYIVQCSQLFIISNFYENSYFLAKR